MIRSFFFALLFSSIAAGQVRLSDRVFRFPAMTVGSAPALKVFMIHNLGARAVNIRIDDFACLPNFEVQKQFCPMTLNVGASCQLPVYFHARSRGRQICEVRVTDSNGFSEGLRLEGLVDVERY